MPNISFTKTESPKPKPDPNKPLGFGKIFTDHMAIMDYNSEKGWHDARIVPFENITMSPAAAGLHYGQLIFEGLKAYKSADGGFKIFRARDNVARLNKSAQRLYMPTIDEEAAFELIKTLVKIESDWIPTGDGQSLYIRPFMFADEGFLGVRPSNSYRFVVILSPVSSYYPNGISPVTIFVEVESVRAVKGGTGESKCAGNYAASLSSQKKAESLGGAQVLWLDGVHRKYIEEIGTSNAFFVIDDKIITPDLNGSILPGITRDSAIKLLQNWGMTIEERPISIDEVMQAYDNGKLSEAFATGTAAIVSPIGKLVYMNKEMIINDGKIGKIALKLYDNITGIQSGKLPDIFNWTHSID